MSSVDLYINAIGRSDADLKRALDELIDTRLLEAAASKRETS